MTPQTPSSADQLVAFTSTVRDAIATAPGPTDTYSEDIDFLVEAGDGFAYEAGVTGVSLDVEVVVNIVRWADERGLFTPLHGIDEAAVHLYAIADVTDGGIEGALLMLDLPRLAHEPRVRLASEFLRHRDLCTNRDLTGVALIVSVLTALAREVLALAACARHVTP